MLAPVGDLVVLAAVARRAAVAADLEVRGVERLLDAAQGTRLEALQGHFSHISHHPSPLRRSGVAVRVHEAATGGLPPGKKTKSILE